MTQKLSDWLSLLESRHPTEIELGLDRVAAVGSRLGIAKPANRVITVAGTNGKGSCIAVMQALLSAAGYSTGVYTSPHLFRFNERVVIDGSQASDKQFCSVFALIESARLQAPEISLTYFEFTTLAALLIIQQSGVDFALLEVGLGGRLDAVNIVDADIAVVTSISLDHQEWLGASLDIIGREKAAIGRNQRPLIYGDLEPVTGVCDEAEKIGADLYQNGDQFHMQEGWFISSNPSVPKLPVGTSNLPEPSIACAIEALLLSGIELEEVDISGRLSSLVFPGRFQELQFSGRQLLLDVAHNPASSARLAELLVKRKGYRRIITIFGIMKDKDIAATIEPLIPIVDSWYLPQVDQLSRAADTQSLSALLYNTGQRTNQECRNQQFTSIESALQATINETDEQDLILVCGSFFLVGPILESVMATEMASGKNRPSERHKKQS